VPVRGTRRQGRPVSHLHLRYLNPLPANVGDILSGFKRVLVPENNWGQLRSLLQSLFSCEFQGLNKTDGRPFLVRDIVARIDETLPG